MEKVLLAIDGITLDRKVFRYAVELCKRIKAELDILQIITPRNYSKYLKKVQQGAKQAKTYLEASVIAATFAEAGEHETAREIMSAALKNMNQLLPESGKAGIRYNLTMKLGTPNEEIIDYVNEHRDVILALYDAPQAESKDTGVVKKKTVPKEIKEKLHIPLVVIWDQR